MTESQRDELRKEIALAIGLEIWRGPVEPRGGWLRAADAAIAVYEKRLEKKDS